MKKMDYTPMLIWNMETLFGDNLLNQEIKMIMKDYVTSEAKTDI